MKALRGFIGLVGTCVVYLGVPLLGWGLGDLRGFFSVGSRAGLAVATIGFGVAVGIQALSGWEGIRGGAGAGDKRVGRQTLVRVVVILVMYAALFLLPYADRRGLAVLAIAEPLRWVGVAFASIGFALIFLSGVYLGRQYSPEVTIQEDHHLVTGGPFRIIRHPRYLGILLLAVGDSLVFRSIPGLLTSAVLLAVLLFRIRDEETLMEKEFGPAWRAYAARSWRLVPFLF